MLVRQSSQANKLPTRLLASELGISNNRQLDIPPFSFVAVSVNY